MYAFALEKILCLVYEAFYLAIGFSFYDSINFDSLVKNQNLRRLPQHIV